MENPTADLAVVDIAPAPLAGVIARLEHLRDREQDLLEASKAANTWTGYRSDWRSFVAWSRGIGYPLLPDDPETLVEPVPVELVRAYILDISERLAPATVRRRLSAIKFWSHMAGFVSPTDDPTLLQVVKGIVREGRHDKRQATPMYLSEVAAAVAGLNGDPKGIRDRAMLLVGWWGAFRRSELVGIDRSHLEDHPDGILVTLPRSKTDQAGEGRQIPLHYRGGDETCPVRALRSWLELVDGEPVFVRVGKWGDIRHGDRTGSRTVSEVVKAAAAHLGLDVDRYTAHSLRAGFVSECGRRRIPDIAVRATTGHKSDVMLNSYARPARIFDDSAGAYFNGDEPTQRNQKSSKV